jgi:hypothetical protein
MLNQAPTSDPPTLISPSSHSLTSTRTPRSDHSQINLVIRHIHAAGRCWQGAQAWSMTKVRASMALWVPLGDCCHLCSRRTARWVTATSAAPAGSLLRPQRTRAAVRQAAGSGGSKTAADPPAPAHADADAGNTPKPARKRKTPAAAAARGGAGAGRASKAAAAKAAGRSTAGSTAGSTAAAAGVGGAAHAAGGKAPYFLVKSEPDEFSIQDLAARPHQTEGWEGGRMCAVRGMCGCHGVLGAHWMRPCLHPPLPGTHVRTPTGVRNYQARNILRSMRLGDQALFYHSSCPVPGEPQPHSTQRLQALTHACCSERSSVAPHDHSRPPALPVCPRPCGAAQVSWASCRCRPAACRVPCVCALPVHSVHGEGTCASTPAAVARLLAGRA